LLEVLQASVGCPNEAVDIVVHSGVVAVEQILFVAVVAPDDVVDPATTRREVVEVTDCVRLLLWIDALHDHPAVAGPGDVLVDDGQHRAG
jgi:hypothetical protein